MACNLTKVQEGAARCILPHYVEESLVNALNSRMCVGSQRAPLAASVQNEQRRSRKFLCSYPKVVVYRLKKYATDHTIAKYDVSILQYTQPANVTFQQYADSLVTKLCKVAVVCDEGTVKNVFNKNVSQSIRHSLKNCCATNPQASFTSIAIQAEPLPAIQKRSG